MVLLWSLSYKGILYKSLPTGCCTLDILFHVSVLPSKTVCIVLGRGLELQRGRGLPARVGLRPAAHGRLGSGSGSPRHATHQPEQHQGGTALPHDEAQGRAEGGRREQRATIVCFE